MLPKNLDDDKRRRRRRNSLPKNVEETMKIKIKCADCECCVCVCAVRLSHMWAHSKLKMFRVVFAHYDKTFAKCLNETFSKVLLSLVRIDLRLTVLLSKNSQLFFYKVFMATTQIERCAPPFPLHSSLCFIALFTVCSMAHSIGIKKTTTTNEPIQM